jgi:hypothetical protein
MQLRTTPTLLFALAVALPLAANAAEGEPRFLDRDLLTDTLTLDEQEPLEMAQAELATAETELQTAEAERDAAQLAVDQATTDLGTANTALTDAETALQMDPANPELQAAVDKAMADVLAAEGKLQMANDAFDAKQAIVVEKQGVVGEKTAAVQVILDEIALTGELVNQLSDKQVQALNSALHSAYQTGLLPFDIDSAWLQRILDEGLGTGPIHQLVTAYAQEARFERLAARFDAKALDTGNETFSEHAERAREKGSAEFDKFVEKVDTASARAEAKQALQEERRAAIHGKALGHSK